MAVSFENRMILVGYPCLRTKRSNSIKHVFPSKARMFV